MSSEAAAPAIGSGEGPRQAALRLAVGVTISFALVEALDWDATFLAPLLAANMLFKLQRAPTFAQGVFFVLLIALIAVRSEEHTSELQSLVRISYAVFCLKKTQQK